MSRRASSLHRWTSLAEEKIRDAQVSGEITPSERFGQPLHFDDPDDPDWWIKAKLRDQQLSLLPVSLEIRLDVQRTLERIWNLASASGVRREVLMLNERIRAANYHAVIGPPSTTQPLDVDAVLQQWQAQR